MFEGKRIYQIYVLVLVVEVSLSHFGGGVFFRFNSASDYGGVFSSHFGDGRFFNLFFSLGHRGGILRFIPMVDDFFMFRFTSGRSEWFLRVMIMVDGFFGLGSTSGHVGGFI